jgi:hypothetical protein
MAWEKPHELNGEFAGEFEVKTHERKRSWGPRYQWNPWAPLGPGPRGPGTWASWVPGPWGGACDPGPSLHCVGGRPQQVSFEPRPQSTFFNFVCFLLRPRFRSVLLAYLSSQLSPYLILVLFHSSFGRPCPHTLSCHPPYLALLRGAPRCGAQQQIDTRQYILKTPCSVDIAPTLTICRCCMSSLHVFLQ